MSGLPVWYFPAHNGDFRLKKVGDTCVLIAENATPAEAVMLAKFAEKARRWWADADDIGMANARENTDYWLKLDREIPLRVSVTKAGKLLLKLARPRKSTLTAVGFADGKVTVSEGTDERAIDTIMKEDKPALAAPEPRAAASVSRPTMCCPICIPGANVRASEVLQAFLTPEQHEQWAAARAIVVTGNLTGHRYVLAHRNTPMAVAQTKICRDLDDDAVLHFHDWSVPPEEEVLASKLILEHREHWLRNEAALTYGAGVTYREVFKNPFGGLDDGIPDRELTSQLGEMARRWL